MIESAAADRSRGTDEVDLTILHALQIAPRATWAEIGAAIGVAPTTVARRWANLESGGRAWIAAYVASPYSRLVFVRIDVAPARSAEAVAGLCARSALVTLDEVAGARSLLGTLVAPSTSAMSHELHALRAVDGVSVVEPVVSTTVVAHGSRWRLDALDPEQERRMRRVAVPLTGAPVPQIDETDRALVRALAVDGRVSATDLATRLDVSVNTARRRVARLLESGWLSLRCDLSTAISGHETLVYLWLRLPPGDLAAAMAAIADLPDRRMVATLAGRHNLLVNAWFHRPEDLLDFEVRIARLCPTALIDDRTIVLRKIKHIGRVLDADGRAVDLVPLPDFA